MIDCNGRYCDGFADVLGARLFEEGFCVPKAEETCREMVDKGDERVVRQLIDKAILDLSLSAGRDAPYCH